STWARTPRGLGAEKRSFGSTGAPRAASARAGCGAPRRRPGRWSPPSATAAAPVSTSLSATAPTTGTRSTRSPRKSSRHSGSLSPDMRGRPVPLRAVAALFLARQHLARPRAAALTARRLGRFVEDVGGLTLDSINVLERAHYLTVWSRFGRSEERRVGREGGVVV